MKTNSKKQYEKPCMDVIEITTKYNLLLSGSATGEDTPPIIDD